MLSFFLIAFGLLLVIGALLIGIYVTYLGCKMGGGSGCEKNIVELIGELMIAPEGAMFWAAFALGFVLISIGYTIKSQSR